MKNAVLMQENNRLRCNLFFILTCLVLLCTLRSMKKAFDLSVYVVIDPSVCGGRAVCDVAVAAVRGGATMVQLRNKADSLDVIKDQALDIQKALADSSVRFILNDYVDLAADIDADGVHIGQGDMLAAHARAILGHEKIIGLTAFTRAHYDALDPTIVDYVGTGPFYATLTKPDKAVLGADGFSNLISHAPVPVVGIGGITPENAGAVIAAGASGVAMMRGVTEAEDVESAVRAYVKIIEGARREHS